MRDLQITSKGIAARGRVHDRTSGRHSNFFLENSQMKKTLAAVAVLGAFAGTAMAADVTLYGVIDEGLVYSHKKVDGVKTDKLSLDSGKLAGARFGLKGTEDLGNGYKVGFILENGYSADDGSLSKYGNGQEQNRLFGREASLFIDSDFGRLTMGRVGQLTSGNGSTGIAGAMHPFGTASWGLSQMYTVMVGGDRLDNTVTYATPAFAGLKVYAQTSLKNDNNVTYSDRNAANTDQDNKADEGKHTADRYYALGATYKNYGLNLALVVDMYDYGHSAEKALDDGYTVTLGGSYDFEVVKAYLGAQYFKDIQGTKKGFGLAESFGKVGGQAKGYGITAGVDVPALGGTFKIGALYGQAENTEDSSNKLTNYGANFGYVYPFSKRTSLYTAAGYLKTKVENTTDSKTDAYQVTLGLSHKF